jgi:hypothetical protein
MYAGETNDSAGSRGIVEVNTATVSGGHSIFLSLVISLVPHLTRDRPVEVNIYHMHDQTANRYSVHAGKTLFLCPLYLLYLLPLPYLP